MTIILILTVSKTKVLCIEKKIYVLWQNRLKINFSDILIYFSLKLNKNWNVKNFLITFLLMYMNMYLTVSALKSFTNVISHERQKEKQKVLPDNIKHLILKTLY